MIDFFIRRPVFAAVLAIVITLVGAIAIPLLPIAQYPELAPPQVTVTSTYVGASAEIVESAVTIPLEQELNGVEGMRYISSTSSNDGSSAITVTFEASRDIEVATVDVQNRVARAAARLPVQVNQTGIVVSKASGQLAISFGLFSTDGRFDTGFISNYADVNLKDALKRVRGVGDVRLFGERKFSMRVWLDPTELARRKLTPQDVARALQEQNLQVAAGQVGQPPSSTTQAYQLAVRARGRLIEPSEFDDIVIQRGPGGALVRIRDVGRADLGAESYATLLRFNGRPALGLGIFQLPSANALDVRDAVVAEMSRLSQQFPSGLAYDISTDTTLAVRASIDGVIQTLIEAVALVILVIFLFLHGWRSVLITALTLPVSLVGTFAFVELFGFSINTLTLFGLTLATGLVVDDAIVVVENIERVMAEKGLDAVSAAREGMKEVAGAVVAISVVLVAVFVPVAFFPGTTGAIYRQFALTIAASVALSTICALTLTPALSALLLEHHAGPKWIVFRKIDQALDWTRRVYGAGLRHALRRPLAVLLVFVLCLGGTVALFRAVPTAFIPDDDQGYFMLSVQGPEGMSLARLESVLDRVEEIVKAQPELRVMFVMGGSAFGSNGPNLAQVWVNLKSWDQRPGADQTVAAIMERVRGPLAAIGDAKVVPVLPPPIRGIGSVGGFQLIVQDTSGSRDLSELADATQQLVRQGSEDARLRGLLTSFTADTPLVDVEVDRLAAKSLGVPIESVFGTLQLYMGSQYVTDFTYASRTYRVYVQAEERFRDTTQDIGAYYARSEDGDMIPLESLVQVRPTTSAQVIRRYNLFRAAEINGQPSAGTSSGQAMASLETMAAASLPEGMSTEWSGLSLDEKESGGQALIIFGLGLLFVFLALAAQYESFALPLVIILSVPLAVLGALALQSLRGLPNDVFCQVGLVMLVGLASKNAILIVEFAEQLRGRGLSALDAAVGAAEVRLRPILMTSVAFLLGVLPLMLAQGAGAAARNSLGTTVFGGMLVSTVVNFVFVPALYLMMERVRGVVGSRAPAAVPAIELPATP